MDAKDSFGAKIAIGFTATVAAAYLLYVLSQYEECPLTGRAGVFKVTPFHNFVKLDDP